jgi:hypothetical protein
MLDLFEANRKYAIWGTSKMKEALAQTVDAHKRFSSLPLEQNAIAQDRAEIGRRCCPIKLNEIVTM